MTGPRPDRDTDLIAEDMVTVLDYLSRLVHGLDVGDWHYARLQAAALAAAAANLVDRLSTEPRRGRRRMPPVAHVHADPVQLRAAIATHGRHYTAARALYPPPPPPR